MLPEQALQRDILHGDIGGEQHIAAVHRAGQANARPPDALLHHLFRQLRQGFGKGLRAMKVQGNPLHLQDVALSVHKTGLQIRAAYVDSNIHGLPPHIFPSARASTFCASSCAAL